MQFSKTFFKKLQEKKMEISKRKKKEENLPKKNDFYNSNKFLLFEKKINFLLNYFK